MTQSNGADRFALITGAATGIGRATAIAFAKTGVHLALADIDPAELAQTHQLIERPGLRIVCCQADLADVGQVENVIQETVAQFGRIDYAFNNAGISGELAPLAESTEENWDRVIGINLKSVWACMKYEIQQMLTQGHGAIVNTASVLGMVGGARSPAYVASKHGVMGLTKSAAIAYAAQGIRVNAVAPTFVETELTAAYLSDPDQRAYVLSSIPQGRLATASDVAAAVAFLASTQAQSITGTTLLVDGGWVAK